jgi:outer membrane receptor protein involved in Fe transport
MRLPRLYLLFASVIFLSSGSIHAQTSSTSGANTSSNSNAHTGNQSATIEGTVYDPKGRVIPGARITLLSEMSVLEVRQSNSQGQFKFEGLIRGTYGVLGNSPGFNELRNNIELQSGEVHKLDLHLELSAVDERVIVSAEPGGAIASQIGSSVSVISQQEIEDRGAQVVSDVLRGLPGVEINQTLGRGGVTSAFIRGGDSDYNLVMVDGIPLNDFGGGFDLSPLSLVGVQQVEVIRGPESALYGSNAVAGVINVVTDHGDGTPHFSFFGEGGNWYTWRLGTSGTGLNHGFSWAYSLSQLQTNGVVPNNDYRNQSSYVSLGYSRSPRRKFNFHFLGAADNGGLPGPYGSDPDGLFPGIDLVSRQNQNLFGYQANYTEQFSSRFQQVTTVSVSTDRFSFLSPFGSSFTNNSRVVANTRSEIAISSKDVLVAGFEYDHDQFKDTFVADANGNPFKLPRESYAFFAENRWTPGSRWFINTGVRVDDIRTGTLPEDPSAGEPEIPASSITKVDPRISIAYLIRQSDTDGFFGATRLHSSFGTGIRPPDGFELGFTDNPNLKPEESVSFDAGVEQRMAQGRATLDVTYFYNRFKDQIVTTGALPNLSSFQSANIAKSRAYGLENSIRVRPFDSLDVSASYTWLNTAILALDGSTEAQFPFVVGQPLLRRPHNSAGYNVTWTHQRLMLNLNGTVRGPVLDIEPNDGSFACELMPPLQCVFRNKGYVLANAGFSYQLPRGVEIYGRLNNFANQKYEEAFGFPSLRLNFLAGVKLQFPAEGGHSNR